LDAQTAFSILTNPKGKIFVDCLLAKIEQKTPKEIKNRSIKLIEENK
jgi:hypothetical protein